jgi:hypothetical protein
MSAALHAHAAAISSTPRQPIATVLYSRRAFEDAPAATAPGPLFAAIFYVLPVCFGKKDRRLGQTSEALG